MGGCAVGTELFRLSTPSNAAIAKRRWEGNGSMTHGRALMTVKKGHLKKYMKVNEMKCPGLR